MIGYTVEWGEQVNLTHNQGLCDGMSRVLAIINSQHTDIQRHYRWLCRNKEQWEQQYATPYPNERQLHRVESQLKAVGKLLILVQATHMEACADLNRLALRRPKPNYVSH